MTDAIVGGLIGGGFAVLAGWLALFWERQHEMRRVARAMLLELENAVTPEEEEANDSFYGALIRHWHETGEVGDKEILRDIFSIPPAERSPIFYSNTAVIGALPIEASKPLVRYHALVTALLLSASNILLASETLGKEQVQAVAYSIGKKYEEMRTAKIQARQALCEVLQQSPWQRLTRRKLRNGAS